MTSSELPAFVLEVGRQLQRRRLPLGIDDYDALRQALATGFGWSSPEELRELCVALWAKSPAEAEIVRGAFARNRDRLEDWDAGRTGQRTGTRRQSVESGRTATTVWKDEAEESAPRAEPLVHLGAVPAALGPADRSLVLVPQYPLTEREIAQAWRRLRRQRRTGPTVELDVTATLQQHARHGVATPPVLVPRRRNTAKLLLLIDRFGSMTPFHGYVNHIVRAIRNAGRFDDVRAVYFHDLPGTSTDRSVLRQVDDPFRPDLDAVLPLIRPMSEGRVYDDPALTIPRRLTAVLNQLAEGTAAVVISDAGAARQRFDIMRLLDTVALAKALHARAAAATWLNPVPPERWPRTTAGQVHRYLPMHPLTREGLNRAVDGLRGRPISVERPL